MNTSPFIKCNYVEYYLLPGIYFVHNIGQQNVLLLEWLAVVLQMSN